MKEFILNELKIEVTYNCPLSCVHCSSDASPENQMSMSLEKCIEIINDAIPLGLKEITFSGGEPLSWKGISDNKSEHTRITRRSNSFNNTMKAIKLANSYNIFTEIHFVALASNYKKLVNIVKLAQANEVRRVSVLRFVPQGRGLLISNNVLSKMQNLELKKIIIDLREKEGFDIRTGSPFNVLHLNNEPECMAAQDRLIVAPDLNLYPCDVFKQIPFENFSPDDEYSNFGKHNINECWKQSKYLEIVRSNILTPPSEPCKSCEKYRLCLAGCLAQKYLFYSSLNKNPDPACLLGA